MGAALLDAFLRIQEADDDRGDDDLAGPRSRLLAAVGIENRVDPVDSSLDSLKAIQDRLAEEWSGFCRNWRSLPRNAIAAKPGRLLAHWRQGLGERESEQRLRDGQVRTLAFWESRSGVRDGVLDFRA